MSDKPFRLPLKKRVFKHPLVQAVAAAVLAYVLKAFWLTFRLEKDIHPDTQPYIEGKKHGIFCFWHGRMILLPFFMPKGREMHVLISQHRDGELIARLIEHFGIQSVRGSTSKGALEATRKLVGILKDGQNISITPDGPRGPAFEAQRGAMHLARQSGCAMIPISFSASRYRQLASWDKFIIPLPFAKIRLQVGAPIAVQAKAKLPEIMQQKDALQASLNAAMQQGDSKAGMV